MPETQFSGLTKRKGAGLDYESIVRARADQLPYLYSAADSKAAQEKEYSIASAGLTAQQDYIKNTKDIAEQTTDLAKKQQMTSNVVGLGTAGLGLYGAYATANKLDKLGELMRDIQTPEYQPGTGDAIGDILSQNSQPGANAQAIQDATLSSEAPLATGSTENIVASQGAGLQGVVTPIQAETATIPTMPNLAVEGADAAAFGSGAGVGLTPATAIVDTAAVTPTAITGAETVAGAAGADALAFGSGAGLTAVEGGAAATGAGALLASTPELAAGAEIAGGAGAAGAAAGAAEGAAAAGAGSAAAVVLPIAIAYGISKVLKNNLDYGGNEITNIARNVSDAVVNVIEAPVRWVSDAVSKICIIVTACTDEHSPEVEVARRYRDSMMSKEEIRGYYIIAERWVPYIVRYPVVKWLTKKVLVDSLVTYGREVMYGQGQATWFQCKVTKWFLEKCKRRGNEVASFTRANGEVV